MLEKMILWMIPSLVARVEKIEKSLANEMVARKNALNRIEKEISKDWVGDEIEEHDKKIMVEDLKNEDIVNVSELK